MRTFLLLSLLIFLSANASAKDSTELAEGRLRDISKISFFCETGREPILSSAAALTITPSRNCRFSGPLDTKRDRLHLQPPFLNPTLSLEELKNIVRGWGANIESETSTSFRFALPGSAPLTAERLESRKLTDPLFHLHAYPETWGSEFTVITASREQDFEPFLSLAKSHLDAGIFWNNPQFTEELKVRPRLTGVRKHLPIEMLSKCQFGQDWGGFGARPSLLFVGDFHRGEDAKFFYAVLQSKSYAWVALEFARDRQPQLDRFMATADAAEEESLLSVIISRIPKDTREPFKDLLRLLKSRKIKTFFMDYHQSYFNFPYTNVAFHGLVIGARNLLWVNTFPASWQGIGVVISGLDHYTNVPGSDVQNFAQERYPGVEMRLINPLEKCQP